MPCRQWSHRQYRARLLLVCVAVCGAHTQDFFALADISWQSIDIAEPPLSQQRGDVKAVGVRQHRVHCHSVV